MPRPMPRTPRGGATLVAVALLAVLAGAGGLLLLRQGRAAPPEVTTHGEWVTIPGPAGPIRAYVAYPETPAPAPAMLVIHEIFGLTAWEPTVADRFAAMGYVAAAPDLLSSRFGATPAAPDSGRVLTALLAPPAITADLDAVAAWLDAQPGVRAGALGVIGFCWGGRQSFSYATTRRTLTAAVVCYGAAPDSAALAGVTAPVLGVYGEADARINADLPRVEGTMRALGKRFRATIYPGTGHGFLKPGRRGADTPAVEQAWTDIGEFLATAFGR